MKTYFIIIIFTIASIVQVIAQEAATDATADIKKWQAELNAEYKDPDKTPLDYQDMKKFKGHDFFPIDTNYRIIATLVPFKDQAVIRFKTSGTLMPEYRKYGELRFTINKQTFHLNVYQSLSLMKTEEYKDHLFLPFTDATTANETYGAGRYIDINLPKDGNTLLLDFNKAYNPYCAYSNNYACPLVPAENDLSIKILAGVRYKAKK
jgi:uncharacterized protein